MNIELNIEKNVGWRVGAFLKSYNYIDDPLPAFLYSNPQTNFKICQPFIGFRLFVKQC